MPSTTLRRRERGYSFEKRIVDYFDGLERWEARRLGGPSTGLPDVVIVNNPKSILYTVEAKSNKVQDRAIVENDQIVRCLDVLDLFDVYKKKAVIFAFKFMRRDEEVKISINKTTGEKTKRTIKARPLQYWFFVCQKNPFMREIRRLACTYDGKLSYTKKVDWDFHIYFNKYDSFEKLVENPFEYYNWTL